MSCVLCRLVFNLRTCVCMGDFAAFACNPRMHDGEKRARTICEMSSRDDDVHEGDVFHNTMCDHECAYMRLGPLFAGKLARKNRTAERRFCLLF